MRDSTLQTCYAGVKPVAQFLDKFMGTRTPDTLERSLRGATAALKGKTPLFSYLCKVASRVPGGRKPMLFDTTQAQFPSMLAGEPHKSPSITVAKPWVTEVPKTGWRWWHAATVILLSAENDIFDRRYVNNTRPAIRNYAAVEHISTTAHNLLTESGLCHVYTVLIFHNNHARIFRFDRSSFWATTAFHVVEEPTHFATFLWRLYNPGNGSYVLGMDDTITFPLLKDKQRMYAEICKHPVYSQWSYEQATQDSLWITAARYKKDTHELELVHCFTFGGIIAHSDGLFSRATRVYRVMIAEDVDLERDATKSGPVHVYALKDAWPLKGNRPEVDFYDMIAKHCADEVEKDPENEENRRILDSIAKCLGSSDLSSPNSPVACNRDLHRSHSTTEQLIPTAKPIVAAILSSILHHLAAYNAGVLHRDISEGNVLFREVPHADPHPENQSFLVDWDNAEFTKEGAVKFNEWFPDRTPVNYDEAERSLHKTTGTLPFMPIQFNYYYRNAAVHGPHHDLESFYWLLVWMVLRYAAVAPNTGTAHSLWETLFEPDSEMAKMGWVQNTAPIDKDLNPPLYELLERLRKAVQRQNTEEPVDWPLVTLKYAKVISWFQKALESSEWPEGVSSVEDVSMLDPDEDDVELDADNGGKPMTAVETVASPGKRKGGKTESPAKRQKRGALN